MMQIVIDRFLNLLPPSGIGNEEQLEFFELHICVKDYCFARDDRLVGVAVIPLKDISEKVNKDFIIRHNNYC